MTTNPVAISAVGLTKRFGRPPAQATALSQVDFSVNAGEFVAIMGASGSGKSTLLHLLGGLTTPDEGRVIVEGRNITELSDAELTRFRRRRIGLVFQSFNLIPALTVEQNIMLPLLAEGHSAKPTVELNALLDILGLAHRRDHRPGALSGGEQQRVAIARALITNPAIVLADEPTGNLDSRNSQLICGMLKKLNEADRRTILMVTHEPTVARWADRVVVLQDGRVGAEFAASAFDGIQSLTAHYQQWTTPEAEERTNARD